MEKKTRPPGITMICAILAFVVLSHIVTFLLSYTLLNLPPGPKSQLIQSTSAIAALNISSVEKLDWFLTRNVKVFLRPFNLALFTVVLLMIFGLLRFKKWALLAMVAFSGFALLHTIYHLWGNLSINMAQQFGKFIAIPLYLIIIIYLTRPAIERQFK